MRGISIDITGSKYNHLTAIEKKCSWKERWLFRCDCGNYSVKDKWSVLLGKVKSCGCKQYAKRGHKALSTVYPREYGIWRNMIYRCHDNRSKAFKNYGGRGISVCNEWRDSFATFIRDMGESGGLQIDRINNDGNYDPSNCRWTTSKINNNNRRRVIHDDLQNMNISRQRKYQIRKNRLGLCSCCGKNPSVKHGLCMECFSKKE